MVRRPPRSTRTDTLFPYTTLFRSGLDGGAAEGCYVGGVARQHHLVVDHVGVDDVVPRQLHRAAGCRGAGLQARDEALLQWTQAHDARRPHHPVGAGPARPDVGLVAPLAEDSVDPLVGPAVLAQRRDVPVAETRAVAGVATEMGPGRRVGRVTRGGGAHLLHGD